MPDFSLLMTHGVFHVLAALITLVSLCVVLSRHPVKSAVFLVVDLFLLAGLYATLDSHFVATIQVLVYAGAILVLFLFVIMLLNLQPEQLKGIRFSVVEAGTLMISLVGFIITVFATLGGKPTGLGDGSLDVATIERVGGNTYVVAMKLMTDFIWPFELASILILLAIVAAVFIAKKDKKKQPVT
jgi:NADH-quinone oxidoreductase subunit J